MFVVACGGGNTPGTDAPNSPDSSGEGVLEPGAWEYAQYMTTQDTCNGSVDGDGGFTVELTAAGFRMVRASSPTSTCTVDDDDTFDCTTPDETQDLRPGTDAVMTGRFSISGRITTPTLVSGTQSIVITCSGSECNTLDPGPCAVTATIALQKL